MEEIKRTGTAAENAKEELEEGKASFDFSTIYTILVLNWKWYVLSLIIFLGLAAIYLRYTTPIYQTSAKILIKDNNGNGGGSSLRNSQSLGLITNSNGLDNEIEILQSHSLAEEAVRDLKLYVTYSTKGRVNDRLLYKTQPLNVDIDPLHREKLNCSISLTITRTSNGYDVKGIYSVPTADNMCEGPFSLNRPLTSLPATIYTRAGNISIDDNNVAQQMENGEVLNVNIVSPRMACQKYAGELSVAADKTASSIALLSMTDESAARSMDYLKQLVVVYNRQANDDKNEIAKRTEEFINGRLNKINAELGKTEGELQNYKEANGMVQLDMNAGSSFQNQNQYEQQLAQQETQIELLNNIADFMKQSGRRFQVLPSNVGLQDQSSTNLINKYNELVLERNRLLRSASENSPVVEPITDQLRDLNVNIRRAIDQARKSLLIQRDAIAAQYEKYNAQVAQTPRQERQMNQMGRQQEVKSGLYLMLLQKREENSISLAATADKGKLIDDPQYGGQVSPKKSMVYGIALAVALLLPSLIFFLMQFFRYKIEGHDDVAKLTKLPILADVAVASETAKTKAGIVVHENVNNQMEEIYRSMRTNLQFMLKEGENTVMFTSTTSGEGKTFNCANLAVSFALLGKKVLLVGLDIRKPRLAELFEIPDHHHGITPLLLKENPSQEEVNEQILSSGINSNLDLLMAGPIPPNPTELIARPSLDKIFNLLKTEYDYILIDTAPVGLVTDTLEAGRVANATVYVCRADYTEKSSFELINELSKEKKLPNMSIVINGIDMSKKKYGYYYGYGKYGKYGRYGHYGHYGSYGSYGSYGRYGNYSSSHYGNPKDNSVKR